MGKIGQVKQLIHEVNRLLHDFSKAYFEQIKIKKLNLSKTIRHVPAPYIYVNNRSHFYFPWELQIWNHDDIQSNIENHEKFKRNFI